MSAAAQELTLIERLVRRDQLIVSIALALIVLLSWIYLVRAAKAMQAASGEAAMHAAMGMGSTESWSASGAWMLFFMWTVMMTGMMLPSAAPVILIVVGAYRRRGGHYAAVSTAAFTSGYVAAWTGFSAVAALTQAALHAAALMSPNMASQSVMLAGGIFVLAGIYQWVPLKNACLSHCRSPLYFISREWREGIQGAFMMGLRHGLFCIGCCWALMVLLFAAGVMNLLWVAGIALFVLLEKLLPGGPLVGRVAGVLLASWGLYLLVRGS
jgi:predicted metal-binding membrane protein